MKEINSKPKSKASKKMTVREVAQILGVSIETVRANGKALYPDLFVKGVTAYLNEVQVTAIKLKIQGHHNLQSRLEVTKTKTQLEKALLIRQAMQLQQEMIYELEKENHDLGVRLDQTEKLLHHRETGLEFYQRVAELAGGTISDKEDLYSAYRSVK